MRCYICGSPRGTYDLDKCPRCNRLVCAECRYWRNNGLCLECGAIRENQEIRERLERMRKP